MGVRVRRQLGDERRDTHDGFRTKRLDARMSAAKQHMVSSVVVTAEGTGVRNRESGLDGELALGTVYVPVVSEFCKSGSKRVGCSEGVVPETRSVKTKGCPLRREIAKPAAIVPVGKIVLVQSRLDDSDWRSEER